VASDGLKSSINATLPVLALNNIKYGVGLFKETTCGFAPIGSRSKRSARKWESFSVKEFNFAKSVAEIAAYSTSLIIV
jgi:hypothetical protein